MKVYVLNVKNYGYEEYIEGVFSDYELAKEYADNMTDILEYDIAMYQLHKRGKIECD